MSPIIVADELKKLEKCGFLAFLMMLILGTLFGIVGVALAHILMKFYAQYYLILVFPLLMAWILGFGLALGVGIGRCTRLNIGAAILVLLFCIGCYGTLLFLNDYYDSQDPKPATIIDEGLLLAEDGQNFLNKLPYIADYVPPVENTERDNQHLGVAVTNFINKFVELAQQPLVIGNIFDLAIFTPIRDYLIYPGVTGWLAATSEDGEQIREHGQLIVDSSFVQTWMLWSVEFLLVFLVALLKTRKTSKRTRKKLIAKLQRAGLHVAPPRGKTRTTKKSQKRKAKTSAIDDVGIAPELSKSAVPPEHIVTSQEEGSDKGKKRKKKKEKVPKEKKGFSLFGGKKKTQQEHVEAGISEEKPAIEMESDEDQTRYALILHQYDSSRESDLIQLIQQVGQLPEDKARRLLKVPSLLKRDVSSQEARYAIEKFNQVQAQVKLLSMEQLLDIQKKQQAGPSSSPQAAAPPPPVGAPEEKYALILKRFEPAQRDAVLELLSSLSGRPADQLEKTMKPPALVLRDATRDEVMMIAQQFQNLQADVQSVTMSQLQQLIAKSKQR